MNRRRFWPIVPALALLASILLWVSWSHLRDRAERPVAAPAPIIPSAFRGIWIEQGSECGDAASEARIDGASINVDRLAFLADRATQTAAGHLILDGRSFGDGDARREQVTLLRDRDGLRIDAPDFRHPDAFVRCR